MQLESDLQQMNEVRRRDDSFEVTVRHDLLRRFLVCDREVVRRSLSESVTTSCLVVDAFRPDTSGLVISGEHRRGYDEVRGRPDC